jgi:hypothetical protein
MSESEQASESGKRGYEGMVERNRSSCRCCGRTAEARNGCKFHRTCISCTRAGCTQFDSQCSEMQGQYNLVPASSEELDYAE